MATNVCMFGGMIYWYSSLKYNFLGVGKWRYIIYNDYILSDRH